MDETILLVQTVDGDRRKSEPEAKSNLIFKIGNWNSHLVGGVAVANGY